MRKEAILVAACAALLLAGCTSPASTTATPTSAPDGAGFAYGARVVHDASAPSGPRAFVLNGSYAPGGRAALLTYVHGPVDDAWGLALAGGWHLAREGSGWRLNASFVEERLAAQSFRADPAAADFVVTGTLPDGAYTASATCAINDHGVTRPCDAPAPITFTISGGRMVG